MMSLRVRRITTFLLLGLLLAGVTFASGCGTKKTESGTAGLSGTLTIAGSTSVQPFSEVLAEEFMAKNKNVQVNVQGGGSSQGVEAAVSGATDIGSASRDLKDEEKAKATLVSTPIAIDGVAIVVNSANKVTSLTSEQVKNIYLGNVKNWKDIGGSNAPITVVTREDGSGTREAFSKGIMNEENIINSAIVQNSTGAVRTTVAGDKNAIGYVSMASVNSEVKAVDLDGVAATEANVKSGQYKLQRPFIYITKDAPKGLAKAFIDFVLSNEGQKIIVDEGAYSVNK
ncbi:MAG: phosphate ABC transporter substrate-binding protein [Syntrophomonas sp.]